MGVKGTDSTLHVSVNEHSYRNVGPRVDGKQPSTPPDYNMLEQRKCTGSGNPYSADRYFQQRVSSKRKRTGGLRGVSERGGVKTGAIGSLDNAKGRVESLFKASSEGHEKTSVNQPVGQSTPIRRDIENVAQKDSNYLSLSRAHIQLEVSFNEIFKAFGENIYRLLSLTTVLVYYLVGRFCQCTSV
ncbi:hypothetical protein BJ165DRAFT_1487395 [Panaeolus papilionaceus]|nr:hypothetical protein BJ165DRAFT_1487395 [Panaeolus papilionaceus]